MSLIDIVSKEMYRVEGLVLQLLGFSQRPIEMEGEAAVVIDNGVIGAYDFGDNTENYRLHKVVAHKISEMASRAYQSLNDKADYLRIMIHEAAHRIRFKLNKVTKDYFINTINGYKRNFGELFERINLEESFAKYAEELVLNYLGLNNSTSLMQRIREFPKPITRKPYEFLTHYFGYSNAKELYQKKLIGGFEELVKGFRFLFNQTNPREVGIPKIEL